MKAYEYLKPGHAQLTDKEKPTITSSTDAIIRIVKTTICGTDLHIIKGDTPEVQSHTTLGHEGIGIIEEIGDNVNNFKVGDKVIISCISSCGKCYYCKKGIYAHCENGGGWILGHLVNGTQAEYVKVPFADNSLYHAPSNLKDDALVMLSDILPTGYEIGVLKGKVKPGCTVAIVGAGPVGLAALLTAQFYSPSKIIMIDLDDNRLETAKELGATHLINSKETETAIKKVKSLNPRGVDGTIANVGVHGLPVQLDIDKLWIKNINVTTGLVSGNTTEELLEALKSKIIQPEQLVTHYSKLSEIESAYDLFRNATDHKAIKLIIENDITI
ncbi:alcohol dehydrogenase catalytic domain-containing protein [Staphylococcus epidermidis]